MPLGDVERIIAQLADQARLIAQQPFLEDHVVFGYTVGDCAPGGFTPRRGTVVAVAGVMPDRGYEVRGVKPLVFVAGPDHVVAVQPAVGDRGEKLQRVRYNR